MTDSALKPDDEKEDVARTMASDERARAKPDVEPEFYENQALASVEAYNKIHAIFNELGPGLFPGMPVKG